MSYAHSSLRQTESISWLQKLVVVNHAVYWKSHCTIISNILFIKASLPKTNIQHDSVAEYVNPLPALT
jgi:hypothetical protein